MNILLDVVLFIRNNVSALKLTPMERIVLITLAGRIGANDDTWILQETLAQECGIRVRHLRNILKGLSERNLVKLEKHGKQYHYQVTLEQRHYSTGIQKEVKEQRHYSTGVFEHSGTTVPVNSGTTVPVTFDLSTTQDYEFIEKKDDVTFPKETIEINNKHKVNKGNGMVMLPSWLSNENWDDFLAHRKAMKCPLTLVAQKKAINLLCRFKSQGQDVEAIIDQSIVNGWKGLFPIKSQGVIGNAKGNEPPYISARAQSIHAYLARLDARYA